MMAAVQEELGLKYAAAKEPIDALIFDRVDKLSGAPLRLSQLLSPGSAHDGRLRTK